MHVVPARVHHRHQGTGRPGRGDLARIRQLRLFLYRKGVHVRAEHHRGSVPVTHQRNDAVTAHASSYLVAETPQPIRKLRGGLLLVTRELGILVEIEIKSVELRIDPVDSIFALIRCAPRLVVPQAQSCA